MSKTQQPTFTSVLSINPYKETYFIGSSGKLEQVKSISFSKTQYTMAYLNTHDFLTALIGVSKNIPDEDLAFAIENKVYEELALDMAVEYNVQFIESGHQLDEKERYFHVFIVDPLTMDETFEATVDKVKYIDQIVPVPLLLKGLYQREIVTEVGVHCFIYFQDNDAFFTIYNDQEFVYTKTLKYSIKMMHERFCELYGEQVSFALFMELLSSEGLASENKEYQRDLIKLFGELFLHINDVLTYAKRAFELETIDQIYIGSQIGAIAGLDEYSQTYLGLISKSFDFDYGFDTKGQYVDQVHQLIHLYTMTESEERYECNFSLYPRPPKFLQRASGKLISISAIALVLAFAYPVAFWSLTFAEELNKSMLDTEYNEVHSVKTTREATINLKTVEKNAVTKLVDAEQAELDRQMNTLAKIHDVKVNYPMKAKLTTEFAGDLNKYKVKLQRLSYHETKDFKGFTFNMISEKDKDITLLLEYLTSKKTSRFHFILEEIAYDEEKKHYLSEMKAVLK
jgi:predicted outer membrane protein